MEIGVAVVSKDPKAGKLSADKIVLGAYLRGQGLTWKEIAKRVDVRNVGGLTSAVLAHGIPEHPIPAGMFEVRAHISAARYHDLKAQLHQVGYGVEDGLAELIGRAAKDRTIKRALARW